MKFSTALFSNALFAYAVLAAPRASTIESRAARRAAGLMRQGKPMMIDGANDSPSSETNNTEVSYSTNWSGAVISSSTGTFTEAYGTFTVPTPSAGSGSSRSYSASAWVGIDGDTCSSAILQSGVDFTYKSGAVSFDSWYEWYPDNAYDFTSFAVSAGDSIKVSIVTSSAKAGTVTLDNLTTGKTASKTLSAPSTSATLCQKDAEWIVEDYESGSSLVSLADFGTVTFTGCSTNGEGLNDASVIDMRQSGSVLTAVTIESNTEVVVKYTG